MENRKTIDWLLFLTTLIIVLFGFVMVYSSSYPDGYYNFQGNGFFFLKKQIIAGVLGFVAMIVTSFIDYRIYRKLNKIFLGVILLAGFSLFTAAGTTANGAQRWVSIGALSIQPSDIIKVTAIVYMAYFLEKNNDFIKKFGRGYIPVLAMIGMFAGIIVIQNDLSTSFVLALTLGVMYLCAGANILHVFLTIMIGASGIAYFIVNEPFRKLRLISFLDPFEYKLSIGWQVVQSIYALGTGGLFGLGLGKSRQKFFYIPESYNDFIFSIIGEELGFIGCFIVILFYIVIIWRGFRIAINANDLFGSFLAVGITALIGIQALVHIAVVTSSMPPTGIALPFISAGGTSLMIFMAAMGILLNISKNSI
ncbi:cell division protein FtsW [Dethiosulfatibacter aminovorans DSM 17477]|uniref:Probable peptidoglycan glycosyltransferase FtsW n=1 Tax=Dethiosulfatibacter aminovorans DSM 17477 TaxID=1121476 RepID=A0A1M6DL14_9FIRM|nr:putative lipid II flippase FtsW [Dethiosulfatibacter aminovorans]SHI73946.1 cell division protein FtsW [Dethiosulfatibacter aminovorans DSM 17477]